jgi:hypothetical protein
MLAPIVRLHNLHIHSKDVELFLISGAAVEIRSAVWEEDPERNVDSADARGDGGGDGGGGACDGAWCAGHNKSVSGAWRRHTHPKVWVQADVAQSRFARLLWAVDEELELEQAAAAAASLELHMSVLALGRQGQGQGAPTTTLLAACVSAGRGLVIVSSYQGPGKPPGTVAGRNREGTVAGRVMWHLSLSLPEHVGAPDHRGASEHVGAGHHGAPLDVAGLRFCSPHLVEGTRVKESGGVDVWLLWSECVGRDSATGGGGGVGRAGDKARCVSWLSRWVSRDRWDFFFGCRALVPSAAFLLVCVSPLDSLFSPNSWSAPEKLSEGAVAGQPTLSSDGLRMYVPVVQWKEVAWSNVMLHNGTGREVLLLPQAPSCCRPCGECKLAQGS